MSPKLIRGTLLQWAPTPMPYMSCKVYARYGQTFPKRAKSRSVRKAAGQALFGFHELWPQEGFYESSGKFLNLLNTPPTAYDYIVSLRLAIDYISLKMTNAVKICQHSFNHV